ncbi:MAG TPA: hypothetical protein VG273_04930 [Bryobacteraceae bacterium]|jgi:hypothetical protein|nr:hypothetical protein [Bryobacteraceae bacterium]
MDSRPSSLQAAALDLVARLQEAARRGDWQQAAALSTQFKIKPLSVNPEELAEYLGQLRQALAVARAARSSAAATLGRLRAVSRFNADVAGTLQKRQKLVDLTS